MRVRVTIDVEVGHPVDAHAAAMRYLMEEHGDTGGSCDTQTIVAAVIADVLHTATHKGALSGWLVIRDSGPEQVP